MTCVAAAPLRASEEIQGNVLAPFPEEHQAFLMLSLAAPGGARRWLRRVLSGITATAQMNAAPVGGNGAVYRSLGLCHRGLGRLSPAALARVAPFDPDFFEADDGPDPLVGEDAAPVTLRCPLHGRQTLSFQRHVHATGAVYAFVPSLSALRSLAAGEL